MRCGIVVPMGGAREAAELGAVAEEAGWDGLFVCDAPWWIDPWVSLAAAAMVTERIKLGTMLTGVSRRKPWELASQTAAVDNLSGGRVILSVGMGATDTGYAEFGEVTDLRTRAELLDEGLEVVEGLWRGQPFAYKGKHFTIKKIKGFPPPPPIVQQPRIPVWVVGAWPRPRSMARVARWDGLIPAAFDDKGQHRQATPEEIAEMAAWLAEHRPADAAPIDIVVDGTSPPGDAAGADAALRPWAEAGATWWIESPWSAGSIDEVAERVRAGPPRLAG